MLCEVNALGNFFVTLAVMMFMGLLIVGIMSGALFWKYFVNATYETWVTKTNPRYPTATMVRSEILQTCKGIVTATIAPALSLYLTQRNMSQAYCGVGELGWGYLIASFFVTMIASDFWEFYYHRLGHTTQVGWNQHKYHHVFYNPSPFAVIADEYIDQFMRSLPLLVFPLIAPVNMDMMFAQFGLVFYGYGVYLHWGHELSFPDAHHPWINTSFQHYCHHAKSINKRPYHTGFMFKIWDQLFGSMYTGDCFCSKCCYEKGERTVDKFKQVVMEDYTPLLSARFWIHGAEKADSSALSEPDVRLKELEKPVSAKKSN